MIQYHKKNPKKYITLYIPYCDKITDESVEKKCAAFFSV